MNIELKFDYHSCVVYIPDGIVANMDELRESFLAWVFEQPDCIICLNNRLGLRYNENDFIKYANEVLLENSSGKAYQIKSVKRPYIHGVLKF